MSTTLTFYLVAATTTIPAGAGKWIALPSRLTFAAASYHLVAFIGTTAEHVAMLAANPKPTGWTGTVGEARAALRANDLTGWWAFFDWFASANGMTANAQYASV